MPIYSRPTSDITRLTFLRKAAQTATLDQNNGRFYISPETLADVNDFLNIFDLAFIRVSSSIGERSREVQESDEAIARLQMYMRDMWEVIRRRIRRNGEPVGVHRFYYLSLEGINPTPESREAWIELADLMIAGDAEAVAAGYDAAVCPSATELQAVLTTAKKELADLTPAERQVDDAQAAIASLRQQADDLIQEVMEELRFHLRKEEAASQRRVMRTYGATFRYSPGELPDPEDVPDQQPDEVPT